MGVAALALPMTPAAAAVRATILPAEVDARALAQPMVGVLVANGKLTDNLGRGVQGSVALVAWPTPEALGHLGSGSVVRPVTVGWASSDTSGSFSVRINRAQVDAAHLNGDGSVNVEAIAWSSAGVGRFGFPAYVDGSRPVAANIVIRPGSTTPLRATTVGTAVSSIDTAADIQPYPVCGWVLKSTYDAPVVIGETWPYGAHVGWM